MNETKKFKTTKKIPKYENHHTLNLGSKNDIPSIIKTAFPKLRTKSHFPFGLRVK